MGGTLRVAIGITVSSMLGDVVDEHELASGRRQEGLISAALAFAAKATSGIGGLLAGIALDLIAFPRGAEAGTVAPGRLAALGLVVGPGLMLLYLTTLIFLSRYEISRRGREQTLALLAGAGARWPARRARRISRRRRSTSAHEASHPCRGRTGCARARTAPRLLRHRPHPRPGAGARRSPGSPRGHSLQEGIDVTRRSTHRLAIPRALRARFLPVLAAGALLLAPTAPKANLEAPEEATSVPGLTAAQGLALASDGLHLYVAFQGSPGHVGVFSRNPFTGRIALVEALTDGAAGVDGIRAATATAVSPSGRHVYVAGQGDDAIAVFARDPATGTLSWLGDVRDGVGGVDGLEGASMLAISPDGAHLYAAGFLDTGIAVFARNAGTGALTYVEVERIGTFALDQLQALTVSPDGRHVYGASYLGDAITVFARDAGSGALTHLTNAVDGIGGVDGLAGVSGLALSRDGRWLYAAGFDDDALAVFSRDPVGGALGFVEVERRGVGTVPLFVLDGPSAVALSPDGRRVYLSSTTDDFVSTFVRDPVAGTVSYESAVDDAGPLVVSPDSRHVYTTPALRDVVQPFAESVFAPGPVLRDGVGGITGLDQSYGVAVAPGGRHVYVTGASDDALNAFALDPETHTLTLIEVERDGVGGVDGLGLATRVAVSPDGRHVYASAGEAAVAVFARNVATGALTFVEAEKDGIAGVDGLAGANGISVSPDGGHVYVAGFLDDAVAVFARNPTTGALTFVEARRTPGSGSLAGAIDVAVSPDGATVYAVGFDAGSLAALARNPTTGALSEIDAEFDGASGVTGLASPNGVAVAPGGREVLVATGAGALTRFTRSGTGTLTFVESRSTGGIGGRVVLAGGGRFVLVPIFSYNALLVYGRDPFTGELGFLPSVPDGALGFDGLQGATDVAVAANGHTFVTGSGEDALALLVPEPGAALGALATAAALASVRRSGRGRR